MSSTKKINKTLRIIENVVFVFAFGFIMYELISTYGVYIYDSIKGKGYLGAIIDPIRTHQYYISIVSIIIILNSTFVLWEIVVFIIELLKQERGKTQGYHKYKLIFKKVSVHYKSSFLAMLIHELLPKVILFHMFWIWLPHFQKFQLFTVNLSWYSWIYGYFCWEFSTWLFHFSSHRVRFLWCLHSPHHAPSELNMTVNWIHFFAESYYSTLIHLVISLLLGVNPIMLVAFVAIDSAWGIFIHVSERTLKNGQLGILQHLIITPSHHRVHHAKSPLYLDTNFANVLPFWDWLFGTLQPIKEEAKLDYGIIRDLDVTNFSDLYFGEIALLYRDIKNAEGIKNKLLYLVKPPGWTPVSTDQTASAMRRDFLKINPELGTTSKNRILTALKSRSKMDKFKLKSVEIPDN
ncbi:MAG TPA: sterol desaturase family protein [Mucilaginibacter sp.]|nr:sterol desaturase family protein [Mucilaginibacter sp.]